jgi:two-component system, OmpR family, response regulator RegX3
VVSLELEGVSTGVQGPTMSIPGVRSNGQDEETSAGAISPSGAVSVLLAEDEESFVDALAVGLAREGFDVTVARDGPNALEKFEELRPDLVLLDIMLPKVSGIDVCRSIRARSTVPIIMVTARGTEIDTVVGLEVGADDYVIKPYRLRELVARMRAVLRRAQAQKGATGQDPSLATSEPHEAIQVGDVRVDTDRRSVEVRGSEVQLRRKEFDLLVLLVENAGRVLTRDTLIDRVWGTDYVGDTKTLDVHIKRLRAHLEANRGSPTLITTVRGVGYRFELPNQ